MTSVCSSKFPGKHTTEKPVLVKAAPKPRQPVPASAAETRASPPKGTCQRCRQGFFCSDHGSQARDTNPKTSNAIPETSSKSESHSAEVQPPQVRKIVDINQPQTCRNKGCGKTFKEMENHESACSFHPGPAIFHDRMRGWKCCDVHVKEFDEFMDIPPCTKGWHNANP